MKMADDVSDIISNYNSNPMHEQDRLERHQLEFDLTWRYLTEYLPGSGKILEIGAATGRYTLELAKQGYQITAVDFASALLDINQNQVKTAGLFNQVEYVLADARDLSLIEGTTYDAILMMGPLYHLVEKSDRSAAILQALDHLKPNGILVASFISRFGIMADILKKDSAWIQKTEDVQSIVQRGRDLEDYPKGNFRGYFCDPEEIDSMFCEFDLEKLALAAVEPCISADDESYNTLTNELRKKWLDLFYKISTKPTLLGSSRHLLYIGRKA